MYLPVSYDSWLVYSEGPAGFGAAMEAATGLRGVERVACPAYDARAVPALCASMARRPICEYVQRGDRVWPVDAT